MSICWDIWITLTDELGLECLHFFHQRFHFSLLCGQFQRKFNILMIQWLLVRFLQGNNGFLMAHIDVNNFFKLDLWWFGVLWKLLLFGFWGVWNYRFGFFLTHSWWELLDVISGLNLFRVLVCFFRCGILISFGNILLDSSSQNVKIFEAISDDMICRVDGNLADNNIILGHTDPNIWNLLQIRQQVFDVSVFLRKLFDFWIFFWEIFV